MGKTKTARVLNVIVYYNNAEEVETYIRDMFVHNSPVILDVAVVCNLDSDARFNELRQNLSEFNNIMYFDYGRNVGYLNALLYTLKKVDLDEYKYVVLSNTDIVYVTEAFFSKLIEQHFDRDIGCIAPSVVSSNSGAFLNPHYKERISGKKLKRNIIIFSNVVLGRLFLYLASLKGRKHNTKKPSSEIVYCPHGCYMIFTVPFLKKVITEGPNEYGAVIYSEEAFVGEMLRKYHYKCLYWDEIELIHEDNAVTGKINYRKRFKMWKESLEYIYDTFYNEEK